jgi:hypothetical protein
MEPYDLSNVDKRRFKFKCVSCKEDGGACIQCQRRGCYKAVHPQCGVEKHSGFAHRIVKHPEGDGSLWQIFCPTHASDVFGPVEINKKRYLAEVVSSISYAEAKDDLAQSNSVEKSLITQANTPISVDKRPEVEFHRISMEAFKFDFNTLKMCMPHVAEVRLREFKRFLILKALYEDTDATIFDPSANIEEVWCGMLLCTADYRNLCHLLLPQTNAKRFLDHRPPVAQIDHEDRYKNFIQAYLQHFEKEPSEEFWPREAKAAPTSPKKKPRAESNSNSTNSKSTSSSSSSAQMAEFISSPPESATTNPQLEDEFILLCLRDLSDMEDITLKVKTKTRLGKVLDAYAKRKTLDVSTLCLKSATGKVIPNEASPRTLDMKNNELIFVASTAITTTNFI